VAAGADLSAQNKRGATALDEARRQLTGGGGARAPGKTKRAAAEAAAVLVALLQRTARRFHPDPTLASTRAFAFIPKAFLSAGRLQQRGPALAGQSVADCRHQPGPGDCPGPGRSNPVAEGHTSGGGGGGAGRRGQAGFAFEAASSGQRRPGEVQPL
jgi:hypothetical protein